MIPSFLSSALVGALGAIVYDPDAADFFTRVVAAGGTISDATKAAVNTFVFSAKSSGYWDKLYRVNLFCGNQLAAALVPLKVGTGSATESNTGFVSGDYTEATGLNSGSTSKYLNTGWAPSVLPAGNMAHAMYYCRSGNMAIGTYDAAAGGKALLLQNLSGTTVFSYIGNVNHWISVATSNVGSFIGARTGYNLHYLYKQGSQVAAGDTGLYTNVEATTTQPAYVFAYNVNGSTPTNMSNGVLAGYSFGEALGVTHAGFYHVHLQAFQTALGRNV